MTSLVVLSALVGNILFVSYIPRVKEAYVCLSENKTETTGCYTPLKMSNFNNLSYPVFSGTVDSSRLTSNNYFKIKYLFLTNTTLFSDWMEMPTNQTPCDLTSCYVSLILLSLLSIIFVTVICLIYFYYKRNNYY